MVVAGPEREQNRIRFKNLLRDAENLLSETDKPAVDELLAPLRTLHDNGDDLVWAHPAPGLAVFRGDDRFDLFRTPAEMNTEVHVGDRFYLRPMLPMLQGDGSFLLLAVSQNRVRLFEATRHAIAEVHLDTLPKNLIEALNVDEWTSTLQQHSESRGASDKAMFHGQGAGEDDRKQDILEYFRRLDDALSDYLADHHNPLVFAGVEYLFPLFQQCCHYRNLVDQPLPGNPDGPPADQLHDAAWGIVEPQFRRDLTDTVEKFGAAKARDLGSADLEEILIAAYRGAVDTLLIQSGASCWGEVDSAGNSVRHDAHREESVDLLDEAAFMTLAHGGGVWEVDEDEMPSDAPLIAAVMRFPTVAAQPRR
jgi:hypothetical protein